MRTSHTQTTKTTKVESEEHMMVNYNDYVDLIRNEAWRRLKKNPDLDYDDLVGQGNLAFCLASKTWNPTKSAFSTHLWWTIRDQMGKIEKKQNPSILHENIDDYENLPNETMPSPDRTFSFRNAINSLSKDAREIIKLILLTPEELCDFTLPHVTVTITNTKKYLRNNNNWRWETINTAINEIKLMLKELEEV